MTPAPRAKLGVAVVGAGFMGELHARAVAQDPRATLAGIVDPAPETGRRVAEALQTVWHRRLEAALADRSIGAFIVATPDQLHEEVACRILAEGRPVLLEKPMAHTLDAAKAIARAAAARGARLLVGQILRFDPRYAEAAALVARGAIGEPIHGSSGRLTLRAVGRRMNGTSNVCFYMGVHDVDALQWISGASITRVYARSVTKLMRKEGIASEDAIFTACELTSGMSGQLHVGWTLPDNAPTGIWARTEIVGTEGVIDLDVRDHGLRVLSRDGWRLPDGLHWPEVNGLIAGDLAAEVRHFVDAVCDDRPFVVPVEDALRAVAVNDAILRSIASDRPEDVAEWRV